VLNAFHVPNSRTVRYRSGHWGVCYRSAVVWFNLFRRIVLDSALWP
jgi:hypothetical protein